MPESYEKEPSVAMDFGGQKVVERRYWGGVVLHLSRTGIALRGRRGFRYAE